MKEIFCLIERCLGCKSCELACAVEHSDSKELSVAIQEIPIPRRRVRVISAGGGDGFVRLRTLALQCRQCENPACAEACIAGGIVKLDDGPSISAMILGVDAKQPESIAIGVPLKAAFIERGEGEEAQSRDSSSFRGKQLLPHCPYRT